MDRRDYKDLQAEFILRAQAVHRLLSRAPVVYRSPRAVVR